MRFATNIADFLACQHISTLEKQEKLGEVEKTFYADPGLELLKKLGLEHESKYLNELRETRGLNVVEISSDSGWEEAAAATREAMGQGAEAIYQATLLQGQWGGRADFLLRVETPSELGPWSYEVVEAKLAHSTKARAIIQLCFYSDLLANIQGVMPDRMHVVLGGNVPAETFATSKYLAYFRKIKRDFLAGLAAQPVTYPEPVEHCGVCDWCSVCDAQWHTDDHLSLVANISRNQRKALVEREVSTLAQLAALALPVVPTIERIAPAPLKRIREQARVQLRGREEGKPIYEFVEVLEDRGLTQRAAETQRDAEKGKDAEKKRRGDAEKGAEEAKGFAALPLPSPGDIFLDFEGDPFAFDQGLEYLIGIVTVGAIDKKSGDRSPHSKELKYEAIWSFDPAQEKHAFVEFIEKVKRIRAQYPDMHIYHYSHYEPTAIKHLSGRHNVCTDDVDELLRAEVFVDLFRVVRQGLRASVESYSIKKMEPFYGFTRTVPLRDATSSLQAFETVLALREDPAAAEEILKTIADYNRDDCLSTWYLREWLEKLRGELEVELGRVIPRPELKSGAASEDLAAELTEIGVLKEQLTLGLSEDEAEWTNEQRACWLLAQLLEWHRREDKSMWWEYYRLCDLSDEELIEDKNALGGLVFQEVVQETKWSFVYRYKFPFQDHSIDRALKIRDPKTKKSAGTLVQIDEVDCTIDLSRGKRNDAPHPSALVPYDHLDSDEQVASLMRIARWIIENGIEENTESGGALVEAAASPESRPLAPFPTAPAEGEPVPFPTAPAEGELVPFPTAPAEGEPVAFPTAPAEGELATFPTALFQVARDILLRRAPRLKEASIEELTSQMPLLEAAKKLGLALDSSVLPIQGPPGSGKTFTGAHMIIELIKAKKRVGVTANSHKVISNLLTTLCKEATKLDTKLSIVQKPNNGDGCEHDLVEQVGSNEKVLERLQSGEALVAAGTAWLWSREEFAGSVDVLFVDEAGQMSLANVLAMSPAAESVILLGDPQQLDQPQQGVHPPGAEVSALEHLLNGRTTIDSSQGLFLSESWRLHPDICAFTSEAFYDGRLEARTENTLQRVNAPGLLDGTGLRFVPVKHNGNQNDSLEEVERIAELVDELLNNGATWTNKNGETAPLALKDILIVAPYNAQVELLSRRLPDARVGTVDKFQGQEAPVVFYSMTTSTPEEAPRGMEFLYNSNRLNVATSRAQCVTVLVASPALFDVQCRTPRQMELANAFCRYLEMATVI